MSVERPMGILQRSADLVQLLADEGALSPAEIAERVDTPRPTVYRLGDALEQAHLTETLPGSRLKLSLRWLRLGDAARAAMSEWRHWPARSSTLSPPRPVRPSSSACSEGRSRCASTGPRARRSTCCC